jgi:hypothetical protein
MRVDPLADWAPAWTPYRYAFNNPLIYIDPDGLFEDEAAARQYAKDKGIKVRPKSFVGKLFTSGSRHNLVENSDGTFSLEHGNTSIQDLGGDLGVMTSVVITPTDVIDSRVENGGFLGDDVGVATHRDGTETRGPLYMGGTGPVGPGRYKKILRAAKTFDKFKQVFRNDKKRLPRKTESGEPIKYEKVDIDRPATQAQRANGAERSGRRLIKGSDGKYYYTKDHYKTFKRVKIPKQ